MTNSHGYGILFHTTPEGGNLALALALALAHLCHKDTKGRTCAAFPVIC